MKFEDLDAHQQYAHETAWAYLRQAWEMIEVKRKAKAQDLLLEARFWAMKVPRGFTDAELEQNIEKLAKTIAFL